jgi:uncharacterized membrane protein (UPF0127 family)
MLARIFILIFISHPASIHADTLRLLDLKIRGVEISAEVADTPATRAQGLMYRKQVAKNQGMLFIFPEPDYYSMWMLNTTIPLSVAFLDKQGVILNIADMAPLTKESHGAIAPAKFALEMNLGWFKAHNIKAGDQVLGLLRAPRGL